MSASSVPLPVVGEHLILSTPAPHVLMMKMNRPRQLNAMSFGMEQDMKKTLDWFEQEPSLWVVILTGNGRAFCAGQVSRRIEPCSTVRLTVFVTPPGPQELSRG